MSDWWEQRAPREKILLKVLGVIAALTVLLQFVLIPVVRGHGESSERNLSATKTLTIVEGAIGSRSSIADQSSVRGKTLAELRAVALKLATERGLEISRITGSEDDEVIMIIDKADPEILFAWLADIELQHNIQPINMTLSSDAGDGVRVSIGFVGKSG